MKKFAVGKNENAPDLTQDEKARLRNAFGQIHLLPQKAKEISQKIQERQMKMVDSRGANRRWRSGPSGFIAPFAAVKLALE